MRKIILFSLVVLCNIGCIKDKKDLFNQGIKEIARINSIDLNSINDVILIPNEGCGGCISEATTFFIDNFDKYENELLLIFTNVKDVKQLKIIVGKEFLERKNVIIDSNNSFIHSKVSSIYPQILKIEKANVIKSEVFEVNKFK